MFLAAKRILGDTGPSRQLKRKRFKVLIYKFKGERRLMQHMSGRALVLIDTAREQGVKEATLTA